MAPKRNSDTDETIDLDFNPELFNKIYWHLEAAFKNLLIRFIWVYGGSSASKTYSVVQLIIVLMLGNKNENTLVLRKYSVDNKDSIFQDFKNIIDEWGLQELFIVQQNYIECIDTGSYVRFRGLDDAEKIKGISGFKRVVLEEVSQFDETDFKQVRKRLRGRAGQQIIGIFNPITEQHWIKEKVFDVEQLQEVPTDIAGMWVNEKGNMVVLKTNYLDNVYIVGRWELNADGQLVQTGGFVDQHVIDDFEKDKLTDNNSYQVYGLGNWGKLRTGGEFWKDFDVNSRLTQIGWYEPTPIHLSFDENVNPYLTCIVWQLYTPAALGQKILITGPEEPPIYLELWRVLSAMAGARGYQWDGERALAVQIDEICLEDPRNRRHHVCNEFMSRYPLGRVHGLFIYGDRTSLKEDTAKEKGENFFTDICKYLLAYRPTQRLQSVNPSVKDSGDFINACYRGATGLDILINEKCKKSIFDYQYALEASDGTISKKTKTHPVTKISYEEFGHPSDAKRYIITVAFAAEYGVFLRGEKGRSIKMGKADSKAGY